MTTTATIKILVLISVVSLLSACSNSRHLAGGEHLFTGSKVNITDKYASSKEKKVLITDLNGLVRPKPNSKTAGIRLKLTVYNAAGNTKRKKGLRSWLRNKQGEPPVFTSSVHLPPNKEIMINHLVNRGYFYAKASATWKDKKNKKSTAVFDIETGPQYTIKKTFFNDDTTGIAAVIDSDFENTLLTPNTPYNLTLLKAERSRIDRLLKEKGFYFFNPENILFVADTSIGNNKVNIYLHLKHRTDNPETYHSFKINNIFVYADYQLKGSEEDTSKKAAVYKEEYQIVDTKNEFKPSVFSDAIILNKGDLYSEQDKNTSLSRLVNMGTFKFVKTRFESVNDSLLDAYFYLTPFAKKSIRFETGALTQNDNRVGTEGSISWKNRNAFRGAEQLTFKINGGIDVQYSGIVKQPDIYNFGAEANLNIPGFAIPFVQIPTATRELPHTIFKLKYQYESEAKLLTINSYNASYGFTWKQGTHIQHQFYPLSFTYLRTDTLDHSGKLNQLYGNLIFNGIIEGSTYEFTYSSAGNLQRKQMFFFDGLLDLAGNLLGAADHADYRKNQSLLFGSAYAQYLKIQPDFRYYYRFSSATTLAARLMGGIGIPMGNSSQLPNIKQFWAGGNSDLRGFPSRLVGPGTFNEYVKDTANQYIEILGDIKLEFNVELRQKLYHFVQGAVFFDAGNIWLYNKNGGDPGGEFSPSFYKELSADVGVGLRFDFSILILRLDLGMPVREAWLPENNRWVFDKIAFSESSWRRQNLVFNIGIGYPF